MKNLLRLKQTVFGLFLLLLLVAAFSCSPYRKAIVPKIHTIETDDEKPVNWTAHKTANGIQLATHYESVTTVTFVKQLPLAKKVEYVDVKGNTWLLQTYPKFVTTEFGTNYAAKTWISRKDETKMQYQFVDTLITTEYLAAVGDKVILSKGVEFTVERYEGNDCVGTVNEGKEDEHEATINRKYLGEHIVRRFVYNEK